MISIRDVGVFVQQDSNISEELNQEKGPQYYQEIVRLAEDLSFDSFWFADHWMLPKNRATLDCWSVLGCLAALTSKIRLGSLVTPITAYPPLAIAKRVLTVQMISRDRVIFGIGAGYYKEEFEAFGVPFANYKKRIEMLRESLTLIKHVWLSSTPVEHKGSNYSSKGSILLPRVLIPPIWLGGSSHSIIETVARLGEGWIPYEINLAQFQEKIQRLRALLDSEGKGAARSVRFGYATRVIARKTEEEALQVLASLGIPKDYDAPTEQQGHVIVGDYEMCVEQLGTYMDAGGDYLVLSPQPNSRSLELLPTLKDEIISKL